MARDNTKALNTLNATAGVLGSVGAVLDARNRRRTARWNARAAEASAADALARGEVAESRSREEYAQARGGARASMAARGLALDEGSPLAVLASIDRASDIDAATIRESAFREAQGFRMQAQNARAGASGAWVDAAGTLLTNASTVAEKWRKRK